MTHRNSAVFMGSMYQTGCKYLEIGQHDRAYQAFRQCLECDPAHEEARAALLRLEQQLQAGNVRHIRLPIVEYAYTLFAKTLVTIGRHEDNDIVVMNTDVSRYHARFGFQQHTCMLEDLGSANGSRLNGLRIQQNAPVHAHDTIGIGLHTQFDVCVQERSPGMSVSLTPRTDETGLAQRYILFSGAMFIGTDCECELPLLSSLVPTPLPYLFKITYQEPYWYVYIHPHAHHITYNSVPVRDYVVVSAGDTLSVEGFPFVFT